LASAIRGVCCRLTNGGVPCRCHTTLSGSETLKGRNPAQTHQGSVIDSLLNKYSQADAEVVKAEQAKSSDDAVKKLKETRLMVKDKIVKQLESPS
jgi:uncharacterized protein YdcH (DUF465 family)